MSKRIAGPEIERLIQLLAKVPGLGPRSARRAALHLIKKKEQLLAPLAAAMGEAVDKVRVCSTCGNVDTTDPCSVCADPRRDGSVIIVVEDVADLWALERASAMNARYHVLGGTLSPLDGVGPDDLNMKTLVARVAEGGVKEVIIAVNATVEGPDDGALPHRPARRLRREGDAAGAWRAGRRRTRLSRRGHARRGVELADRILTQLPVQGNVRCADVAPLCPAGHLPLKGEIGCHLRFAI